MLAREIEIAHKPIDEAGEPHREQAAKLRELLEGGIDTDKLATSHTGLGESFERASRGALIAHSAQQLRDSIAGALGGPPLAMAEIERAKGEPATLSNMGAVGAESVAKSGEDVSRSQPGVNVPDFVRAAFDIASAVSELGSEDVALSPARHPSPLVSLIAVNSH